MHASEANPQRFQSSSLAASTLKLLVMSDPDLRRCRLCFELFVWCEGERDFYRLHRLRPPRICCFCRVDSEAHKKSPPLSEEAVVVGA